MNFGYVKGRPLIGISRPDITETIAQKYDLQVGVYILDITPGSGADITGLKKGDILVSMDGKEVKTMLDLDNIKKGYKPDDTVNVIKVRQGEEKDFKLTFSEER